MCKIIIELSSRLSDSEKSALNIGIHSPVDLEQYWEKNKLQWVHIWYSISAVYGQVCEKQ